MTARARALTGHDALCSGVGESRSKERTSRRMAGVARKICRDMTGRLGSCWSALNMALSATARRDTDMGKACAHPRGGTVTGVAGLVGGHVIRRLALGDIAVMALSALARNYAGVTEKCDSPRRG